jgi:probable O-glycosylation ligase (exosortase A-associated)
MAETKNRQIADETWIESRLFISKKTLLYLGYIVGLVIISIAAMFVDPLFIIGGAGAIIILALVVKYPFFGFFLYLTIYIMRPGERLPALGAIRLELLIGVFLLAVIALSDALKGSSIRFPKDRVTKILLLFIGVMILGFVFSEWKSGSFDIVFKFIKIYILYYFIVVMADRDKRFQYVFWFVVLFTSGVGIEAAFQYFSGNYRINQGIMRIGGSTSYGEHANSLAMYMATTIPMLLYIFVRYKIFIIKILAICLILSCLVTLVITGSRSGILCMIGIALTYAWFSRQRVAYFIAVIFIAVASWFVLPEQYKERYGSIVGENLDGSSQGRIDAWKAGLGMFIEKPLLGVGPGIFAAAYLDRHGVWLNSHSLYIEMLATTGLIGTAVWVWLLIRLIGVLSRLKQRRGSPGSQNNEVRTFATACYAILAGLFIAGVFGHILLRDTWYIMAALIVARNNLLSNAPETR